MWIKLQLTLLIYVNLAFRVSSFGCNLMQPCCMSCDALLWGNFKAPHINVRVCIGLIPIVWCCMGSASVPGFRDRERRPRGVGESATLGGTSLSDSVGADLLRGERIPRGMEWDLLCWNISALRALQQCFVVLFVDDDTIDATASWHV